MIFHFNIQYPTDLNQAVGNIFIGIGRRQPTGRMVVHGGNARSVFHDGDAVDVHRLDGNFPDGT